MPRRAKDWTGFTKGTLTLLTPLPGKVYHGKPLWLAECSCGRTREVEPWDVSRGRVLTCGEGCKASRHSPARRRKRTALDTQQQKALEQYGRDQRAYTKAGHPWTVQPTEYVALVTGTCAMCDEAPPGSDVLATKAVPLTTQYAIGGVLPICIPCRSLLRYAKIQDALAIAEKWLTCRGYRCVLEDTGT